MCNKYEKMLSCIKSDSVFNPFEYLCIANELLINPVQQSKGRELIIRALDQKNKFNNYMIILKTMVRKSGLYPYLLSEFSDLNLSESLATEIYKSPHSDNFIFHSMQKKIYNLVVDGENVVLSAPTSMGKSAVIDSLIASGKFDNIVIIVPTIALIDETRRRIHKLFSEEFQIINHSAQKSVSKRKIFILTQERVNERNDFGDIDLLIVDEFYKLAFKEKNNQLDYDERVISLNVALSKILSISKQFYMIGPNINYIQGLERLKENYIFLSSDFNTVALNISEYNIKPLDIKTKDLTTVDIIKKNNGQFIIYCKSPKVAEHISKKLISSGVSIDSHESEYTQWLSQYYSPYWQYIKSINNGIGIHYGTLPRAIQQYTIELFKEKKIRILICTSTIIEGVNTNAEHVIIYDNRDGSRKIDKFTHNNIKGRAGRMSQYFIGNVHCLETPPEETKSDSIVEIPLGAQNEDTPLNLIAGIESAHINESSKNRLDAYLDNTKLPIEIVKKHASYPIETINNLFIALERLDNVEISLMCFNRFPDIHAMRILCNGILTTSISTIKRNNISTEIDNISGMLYSYLNAKSHQDYFNSQLERIFKIYGYSNEDIISENINRELKISRNVFSYTIPKSLALQQDIINFIIAKRELDIKADFSHMINTFEKFHLPGNVAALEEMGVPVQSLQKINFPEQAIINIDEIVTFLKSNFPTNGKLSLIEKKLIEKALF